MSLADRKSDPFADLGGEAIDAFAQRGCAVGDRADRLVLRTGLRRQRIELGPRPGQGAEEVVGALVAVRRKLGEALVDHGQAAVDLRDHLLRGAFLFGDPVRQRLERGVGMVEIGRERLRGLGSGLADAGGGLLDQRRDRAGLDVDPGADFGERRGGAVEQCVEGSGKAGFRFVDASGCRGAGAFDFGQPRGQPVGRLGDDLVGLAGPFGELADLVAELGRLLRRFAADGAKLLGELARGLLGARQILEQHADVVARGLGGAVERFAVAQQLLAAAVEFARDPAELAGGVVAELHQMLRDHRQLGAAVVDPLREHFEQRFERLASARIAMTERVKRSASLRRVRPNISQTRPISASGPAATAIHCAIAGEVNG